MHTSALPVPPEPPSWERNPPAPIDSVNALQDRLALATPKDVLLGMFLESSFTYISETEGRAVAHARRKQILGDQNVVGFFRYPVAALLRLLQLTLSSANPTQDIHRRIEPFGRAAVRIFFDSPVGKTMRLLGGSDAHRMLGTAPAAYVAVSNFGGQQYTRTGERSGVLTFRGDLLGPAWQQGIVKQGLEAMCSVKPQIDVDVKDLMGADYTLTIRW